MLKSYTKNVDLNSLSKVWFLCNMFLAPNQTYAVASVLAVTRAWVFMRRFRLFLGQCVSNVRPLTLHALLKKCLRISLYLTDDAVAKLYVT